MLVTGGSAYQLSGAEPVVEPALAGLSVTRLAGIAANPRIEAVERGISLWREERPAFIVAAGGGSVLDVAKLIGLLGPSHLPWDAFLNGCGDPDPPMVPVIAIPTTAGSGAEATRFAAVYVAGRKYAISHPRLRPSHAFVDALLTASVPPDIAAATGLDALAQAIESLWAVSATPESQALAEAALGDILPCLPHIVRAPTPLLRERMARGAHLAGRAIDISRTTAAHALSYALTTELGVPHGHAVALLLPSVFRINAKPAGRRLHDPSGGTRLAATMDRIAHRLACQDGEEAACFLERLVSDLGLATGVAARGPGASADSLAGLVNAERLGNNPVALSMGDARDIYARLIRRGANP